MAPPPPLPTPLLEEGEEGDAAYFCFLPQGMWIRGVLCIGHLAEARVALGPRRTSEGLVSPAFRLRPRHFPTNGNPNLQHYCAKAVL